MTQDALDAVVSLLDLEAIEVNIFRGRSPDESRQRVFGGQVAGQALIAAARTIDDSEVHSLHAYFLRPGDPAVPILYEVERLRDGRSFATRRVVAIQHGRPIFNLQANFQRAEEGFDHQRPMPDGVPEPESLPDFYRRWAPFKEHIGDVYERPRPLDMRYVDWTPPDRSRELPAYQRVWLRADGTLPDDPTLHLCLLAYASDMTVLDTSLLPHGSSFLDPEVQMASLDHAMWFHRPFRMDEWLLYEQDSPSASGGRGLGRGFVYRQDGTLVASVVQEGLIRRRA